MQTYITRKRFKQQGLDGNFNLPCGTVCPVSYDFIMSPDGRSICTTTSETAWEYFRENTDEGKKRQAMLDKLYAFYDHGDGRIWDDIDISDLPPLTNTYWKNLLRTMPTPKLTNLYYKRIGVI